MCSTDLLHCEDAAHIVAELESVRREEARLAAHRAELLDRLRRTNEAHEDLIVIGVERPAERVGFVARSTRAQVACALRVSEQAATQLLDAARMLVDGLPSTLAALRSGELSYRHAAGLADEAASLPREAWAPFESAVLAGRLDVPVGRFAARCRRVREHLHPDSIEVRARVAQASRSVTLEHARDGMGWLIAYLPIMQAELAHTILTGVAMDVQESGDPRTLDQLRADALVNMLLSSAPNADPADGADASALRGAGSTVSITIPALTLLGHGDAPATLDGYGPIPLETAKVLAAQATSWRRILTHPVTGVQLAHDRTAYRVPADLRRWLAERDGTCRFPGCGRRARRCDLDHTVAWEEGGCTDHDNLAHLCRSHHRLKHHTTWWARFEEDLLVWTSPAGDQYASAGAEDRGPPVLTVPGSP